jgi:hypothetical protein
MPSSTSATSRSSASPTQPSPLSSSKPSGLSKGALAGIVLAGLVGIILVLVGILLLFRRRKMKNKATAGTAQTDADTTYNGQANYQYSAVGMSQKLPHEHQNATEAQYSRVDMTVQGAPMASPALNANHARAL